MASHALFLSDKRDKKNHTFAEEAISEGLI